MNLDRFHDLAAAYGSDLARWPNEHHDGARRLAATDEGQLLLAQQAALDDVLAGSRPLVASISLRDRVMATAPSRKPARPWRLGWGLKAGLGAGLVSAGIAGVAFGAVLNTASPEPGELALNTLAAPASATAFGPAPDVQED